MTNNFDSLKDSDVIFVIGSNTIESNPAACSLIKERTRGKDDKAALIICSPRKAPDDADIFLHLQPAAGTETALINSIMNVIIREELNNEEFIEKYTENFDDLKKSVAEYPPQKAAQITGVPRENIIDAAWTYANGKNSAIFYDAGLTQTNIVRALSNLVLLCGMFGRSGVGLHPLRDANAQEELPAQDLPNHISHDGKFASPGGKAKFISTE